MVFKDRRLETSRRGKQQLKVYLNSYEVRTHVLVLFYVLTVYYYIEKYFQIFCSTRALYEIVAVFPIKTFPISTFMFTFDIICHYIYSYSIENLWHLKPRLSLIKDIFDIYFILNHFCLKIFIIFYPSYVSRQ